MHFFVPEIVLKLSEKEVHIFCDDNAQKVFDTIRSEPSIISASKQAAINIKNKITKPAYIDTIQKLQQHILRGDCYEINFCQEFFAEDAVIDPLQVYHKLITAFAQSVFCII